MFHFISIFKLHHLHSKFKIRTDLKKVKLLEHKVINVIKEVKEIEVFVNKQKIETIQVYNDELQESWQTYQILLELLTKEKVT